MGLSFAAGNDKISGLQLALVTRLPAVEYIDTIQGQLSQFFSFCAGELLLMFTKLSVSMV
jgi:hypothetical protein